jgi:hypothetical protein
MLVTRVRFPECAPPTDRPPDRPDRGRSVYGGCSQERVSTRYPVHQLASSLFLAHSLSGRSTPFAVTAIFGVRKASDYAQVPSQVGSSHEVNRVVSWMHPRCVTFCHPSSNLSRNLSLRGGFLPHPIQQVERTSVTLLPVTRRGSARTSRGSGLRAAVR